MTGGPTRRELLLGGTAAGILLAAGCRREAPIAQPGPGSTGLAGGGVGPRSFPVTIEHRYGTATIPAEPQRVVALGLTDVDAILALGVKPVGFIDWYGPYPKADIRNGLWPWSHTAVGDAKPTVMPRNDDKFNFESIAALRPDLLVAQYTGMTEEEYQTASRIAPTVAQGKDFPDFEAPWDVTTGIIGRALGREARAAELVTGVKERFAAARRANPQFAGRTAMLVDFFEGTVFARGPKEPHGKVLAELGFGYPAEVAKLIPTDKVLAELSLEQLDLFDTADVVIVGGFDDQNPLLSNPLYQGLDIVRQGRVVPGTEPVEGALYWASVTSLPFAIERLVPQLTAAVDANPATAVPGA